MTDAAQAPATSSDALNRITQLAQFMLAQEAEVARLTQTLAAAKAALDRARREDLPELMRELGLESITLASGEVVTVRNDVAAAIPPARREEAFRWLERRGFGGLIRTEVSLVYGREEREQALKDAEQIRALTHHDALITESVHPQMLRAFVREQMEAGQVVPFDLFGVHPFSEAKIKR